MKLIAMAVVASVALVASGAASASEALAKSSGCMGCHDVSAKKVGPSFKDIAAKYKGNADAAAKIEGELTSGKGHPAVKAKPEDVKTLVKWVLSQ